MYNFFLGIFIFISIFLVFLIMIQNEQDINPYPSNIVLGKSRYNSIYCNSILTRVIYVFAFLFFLISMIICNISYNNII